MALIDIKPELEKFVAEIATKNTYYGTKISASVIALLLIEIRDNGGGVLAPYWFSVTQKGRGPRRSTKDTQFWKRIYKWMGRNNMFKSDTEEGKIREAKSVTWYINKYGDQHFRSQVFIDIYETARKQCKEALEAKYRQVIHKITIEVL